MKEYIPYFLIASMALNGFLFGMYIQARRSADVYEELWRAAYRALRRVAEGNGEEGAE